MARTLLAMHDYDNGASRTPSVARIRSTATLVVARLVDWRRVVFTGWLPLRVCW